MIIKKIEVKGTGKKTASLEFSQGLNVVAGASNTGKSYVVECIKFILGAKKAPKPIVQAKGYEYVAVLFENEDGSEFSLQRKLKDNSETVLTENKNDRHIVLKGKHTTNQENLSNWFLTRLGLGGMTLLKGREKLSTQSLSLRTLENVFVVDETRIVAAYSPLGTGQRTETTLEFSLLRTLLTGIDDVRAKKIQVEVESSSGLKTKMHALEGLIFKLFPGIKEPDAEIQRVDRRLERLSTMLVSVDQAALNAVSRDQYHVNRRGEILDRIQLVDAERDEASILAGRFTLLKEKYQSDLARLSGIGEAANAFDLYTRVACPTCGQEVEDVISLDEIANISIAAHAEAQKIKTRLSDLGETINDIEINIALLGAEKCQLQAELSELNAELGGTLKSTIKRSNEIKARIHQWQYKYIARRSSLASCKQALAELGSLKVKTNENQPHYDLVSFDDELFGFVEDASNILDRWDFPDCKPTSFSFKARDLVIGGTPRGDFGKGYRAVAFSAFIIALMESVSKSGRHPGFVVLDSPLTTYKKADIDRGEEDESVTSDMVFSFYKDLSESYKNRQIIVFDNQEPEQGLRSKIKYEHFSRNSNVGRYGFFPV